MPRLGRRDSVAGRVVISSRFKRKTEHVHGHYFGLWAFTVIANTKQAAEQQHQFQKSDSHFE